MSTYIVPTQRMSKVHMRKKQLFKHQNLQPDTNGSVLASLTSGSDSNVLLDA